MTASLQTENLSVVFDTHVALRDVNLTLPIGKVTTLLGTNGCGKSTLMRTLARAIAPTEGQVLLNGQNIRAIRRRALARTIGFLPQAPLTPQGMTVQDLVSRGRAPHMGALSAWTKQDSDAVAHAIEAVRLQDQLSKAVDALSGGQRQRAWIAMVLAQKTPYLLLDEPITHLDMVHQIELLDRIREANLANGKTIIMVLHDLNLAARYSDNLVFLKEGKLVAHGAPSATLTEEILKDSFNLNARIINDPVHHSRLVIPLSDARYMEPSIEQNQYG